VETEGVEFVFCNILKRVSLQKLKDWPHKGVPKEKGTRDREKKLYSFQRNKHRTYNPLLTTLVNFKTKDPAEKKQILEWSDLLRGRLTSLEREWKRRKAK